MFKNLSRGIVTNLWQPEHTHHSVYANEGL